MFFGEGFFGLVLFALWVYSVLDVISTEAFLCRNLPKMAWLFLVIVLPDVGAIAWFICGRPVCAGWRPGDTQIRQPRRRITGLEDSDAWSSSVRSRPSIPPRQATTSPPPIETSATGPAADTGESAAVRERRLMEWEAELRRREEALRDPSAGDDEAPPS